MLHHRQFRATAKGQGKEALSGQREARGPVNGTVEAHARGQEEREATVAALVCRRFETVKVFKRRVETPAMRRQDACDLNRMDIYGVLTKSRKAYMPGLQDKEQ